MSGVGGVENDAPPRNGFRRQTMMHHSRREKAQSGMAVLVVIPGEELLGEGTGILKTPEAFRETRPVFQSPEVAFRIRLSSKTWGRLWVLVMPRSAIRKATGLDVMEEPRSA